MSYIRKLTSGKPQIIKDKALCDLLKNQIPPIDTSIVTLMEQMDKEIIRTVDVSKGALSNAHGDWYEWLLAISAWNFCAKTPRAHVPILLPNISRFDVARLYENRLYSLIQDLRSKIEETSEVNLITSNPDFVILERSRFNQQIKDITPITRITEKTLHFLSHLYEKFPGTCHFDEIKGYIAVKTSLRPDRRLQIPHEGSLMKAIYKHLQTREWIINPTGLKYYAFSTRRTEADRKALKTVATHSITSVSSLPQAAVDEVFVIDSFREAENVWATILLS